MRWVACWIQSTQTLRRAQKTATRLAGHEHYDGDLARLHARPDGPLYAAARHLRFWRPGGARRLHAPRPGRALGLDQRTGLQGWVGAGSNDAGSFRSITWHLPRLRTL